MNKANRNNIKRVRRGGDKIKQLMKGNCVTTFKIFPANCACLKIGMLSSLGVK